MPAEALSLPPTGLLSAVVSALERHGAPAAVGGSALLASLGLVDRVRDWDLTTDGSTDDVEAALQSLGVPWARATAGDPPYATRGRYAVTGEDHEVEVLVGFALRRGDQVVPLPTRVAGSWRGLPMADPAVWLTAYRLLGRHDKAAALERCPAFDVPSCPGDGGPGGA